MHNLSNKKQKPSILPVVPPILVQLLLPLEASVQLVLEMAEAFSMAPPPHYHNLQLLTNIHIQGCNETVHPGCLTYIPAHSPHFNLSMNLYFPLTNVFDTTSPFIMEQGIYCSFINTAISTVYCTARSANLPL